MQTFASEFREQRCTFELDSVTTIGFLYPNATKSSRTTSKAIPPPRPAIVGYAMLKLFSAAYKPKLLIRWG